MYGRTITSNCAGTTGITFHILQNVLLRRTSKQKILYSLSPLPIPPLPSHPHLPHTPTHHQHLPTSPPLSPPTTIPISKSVPAKRAGALVTTMEPLIQTVRMKGVLARPTRLIRKLLVGGQDGVADGAFGFAGHGQGEVVAEEDEAVCYCLFGVC